MSGEFTARERAMRRDEHQIAIAQEMFEWWWATGISTESVATMPLWDNAHPRIQAFWMDGAWRVLRV